jgi:hypothetical protein
LESFSNDLESFSIDLESFSIDLESFSIDLESFSIDLESFSNDLESFSDDPKSFFIGVRWRLGDAYCRRQSNLRSFAIKRVWRISIFRSSEGGIQHGYFSIMLDWL